MEIWKDVKESNGLYQISNLGRLKSFVKWRGSNERIRKSYISKNGYLYINLLNLTTPLHRLIAIAFIPNPENKPTVNHIDGNKLNNNIDNLEWNTYSENNQHAYDNNLTTNGLLGKTGYLCKNSKEVEQITKEGDIIAIFGSCEEANRLTGIFHISAVCRGERQNAGGYIWQYK